MNAAGDPRAPIRFAFAADRDIGVACLQFLLDGGFAPEALLLSATKTSSHAGELEALCAQLSSDRVLVGKEFRDAEGIDLLRSLDLDYIVCVHFPYIVPEQVLDIPRLGVLNLHPAYLPYNRGWHTPSWAILEGTPYGATLHFMSEEIDAGDIVHQAEIDVRPDDTAATLYHRIKSLELEVFKRAWPRMVEGSFERMPQPARGGTAHSPSDLRERSVQEIDLREFVRAGDLIRRLRALTTDRLDEAAYAQIDGRRVRIQVRLTAEEDRDG